MTYPKMSLKSARVLPAVTSAWTQVPAANKTTSTVERIDADYNKAKPFSEIPGPSGLPWFGEWWRYKQNPNLIYRRDLVIRELNAKYGDIVKEHCAGHTFVHLFNLEHIKQVYEADGKYPKIPALLAPVKLHREKNQLAPGLGNSNGEDWYKLRAIVQHIAVRPQSALEYLPMQNQVADDFLEVLDANIGAKGEVPHINNWFSRWGLESAAKTFLDQRLGCFEEGKGTDVADRIILATHTLFDVSTKLWFSLPWYKLFPTPTRDVLFKNEDFINKEADRLLYLSLDDIKSSLNEGDLPEDQYQFLRYLLSKSTEERDISAVVRSVLTDTLSTTSIAILNLMYCLANNPQAQEAARQEAQAILTEDGQYTKDSFNSSHYTKSVLKETFRFLPIGIDIQRISQVDLVIGGYQIPKGTFFQLEPYVAQHKSENVKYPERFLPERWLRSSESEGLMKKHPYLLIPFSIGTRTCVGRRFAEQELVMMMCKILMKYRLEYHHAPIYQRYRMLQVVDDDVKIKFIRR